MPMTRVQARVYVSRPLGGTASQETLDAADEAIERGYQDWQAKKFWRFLLKDTAAGFTVASVVVASGDPVLDAPSSGAFDGVNIGVTVTGSGIPADTTVLSYTRGTDGTVATITLSDNPTASATVTLTFSGDIPIIAGVNEYNVPTDYSASATAKFTTTPRTLTWRHQELWDRLYPDETIRGLPSEYTTYNPVSELTQNYGETRLRFNRIPDTADTLRLRYFRKFNTSATNIDMPDGILYKFLDFCRSLLLDAKRAIDNPGEYRDGVLDSMQQAHEDDEDRNSEDDVDSCIKSQYEMPYRGPLWGNGDFDQYRY